MFSYNDGPKSLIRDARPPQNDAGKHRVLIIDDDQSSLDNLSELLLIQGYEVTTASHGGDAIERLRRHALPDIILLDLQMPVMDGWSFRAIQKDDPEWGVIPVITMTADTSERARSISAEAHVRKPLDVRELLSSIDRVITEQAQRLRERLAETERLAALGRLAAGVGHEINNPLSFVMLNLAQSLEKLQPAIRLLSAAGETAMTAGMRAELESRLVDVSSMLADCEIGTSRIRDTVLHLQQLSRRREKEQESLDVNMLIEQSVTMVWNQIRHRAQLTRDFAELPKIYGDSTALGQVFLNVLVNAAQAIPEGEAAKNEIRIATRLVSPREVVIEISDSGNGMNAEVLSRVFEPFFTTKPVGQGTGLGLSISRQTVSDHGGRISLTSEPGLGTMFRIFLPVRSPPGLAAAMAPLGLAQRARILVIDDEPLIGRIMHAALESDHEVTVVKHAADALARLDRGEIFDLVLCDLVMPDISGPEFYHSISQRWPVLLSRLAFMTGGAFTQGTMDFIARTQTPVLCKPFAIEELKTFVHEVARH